MKYALLLMLFAPLVAAADCSTNWMQCSADSKLHISSFTMRATETITAITAERLAAVRNLEARGGKPPNVAGAKAVLEKTDKARALWNAARAVCRADESGNCATKEGTAIAFEKLAQAQEALK